MKKSMRTILFIAATGLLIGTTSCKKNKTGDLKVSVIDGVGNPLGSSNTVYLYRGKTNYDNATYTETAQTNQSGQVTFLELEPGDYYADCDWTNQAGGTVTSKGGGSVDKKTITTITIAP